jgi:hypothetical protein
MCWCFIGIYQYFNKFINHFQEDRHCDGIEMPNTGTKDAFLFVLLDICAFRNVL